MAEAAGKEGGTPEHVKEKQDESDSLENKSSSQQSQQTQQGKEDSDEELECAVCLQKCVHPVRLPCTHIFCFLCVKGVANQSKRCAMCRQEIPADFLDHPTLLSSIEAEKEELLPGGYQWFYEGRNGWWQYDERTSHELEAAYGSGQRACEVLVAGFLYIIDFDRMIQLRRNDPSRRRRIKRDLSSIPKKGVAGIKLPSQLEAELSALHTAAHAIHIPNHSREGDMGDTSLSPAASNNNNNNNNNNDLCPRTPTAPSNTPQTPHTPSAASSSSGSPDTNEPTHLHHALASDTHHHHHYHHHLPPHYHHIHHNQLHIPHLTNNLIMSNDHATYNTPPQTTTPPQPQQPQQHPRPNTTTSAHTTPHVTTSTAGVREAPASVTTVPSVVPLTDVEEAAFQMDQLSLLPDTPEFYPLDGPDETEQYHLTLSSEDE